MGNDGLGEDDSAAEIELPGSLPVVESGIEEGLGGRASGVGDADVDASKTRLRGFDEAPDGGAVTDVKRLGLGLDAKASRGLGRDLVQLGLTSRAERQVRAFCGERQSSGLADSAAGAGHKGDPAFQSCVHAPYDSRVARRNLTTGETS